MYRYGVAYPDGFHNERTINHMHEFPQVRECSTRESAIKIAESMNEYMHGKAIPFENAGLRHEVDWQYITEHEIK